MPLYQEATFHDRQVVGSAMPSDTISNVFIDVPGAAITTKDLSQTANYNSWTSLLLSGSLNNSVATFRALADGSPIGSEVPVTLRSKDSDVGFTILGSINGINPGTVLNLQYKIDQGTLTLQEYAILIDGIPKW